VLAFRVREVQHAAPLEPQRDEALA
jgi:hypothetical protein